MRVPGASKLNIEDYVRMEAEALLVKIWQDSD
jgi:hypothetical protein